MYMPQIIWYRTKLYDGHFGTKSNTDVQPKKYTNLLDNFARIFNFLNFVVGSCLIDESKENTYAYSNPDPKTNFNSMTCYVAFEPSLKRCNLGKRLGLPGHCFGTNLEDC